MGIVDGPGSTYSSSSVQNYFNTPFTPGNFTTFSAGTAPAQQTTAAATPTVPAASVPATPTIIPQTSQNDTTPLPLEQSAVMYGDMTAGILRRLE
jgi:hypothetical protein